MVQKTPWNSYRTSPEGFVDVLKKPAIPLRRKIGATAAAGVMLLGVAHTADVMYSEMSTPDIAPKLVMAVGSVSCKNAKAMVVVYSGYGIQNGEQTAWKITSLANERGMCTQWVNNGTDIDIEAVRDAMVAQADENGTENIVSVGESVGGIEAAMVINSTVEKHGDKYKFPGLLADSTPAGKDTLKWVNPTIAEKVAEYCRYFKVGDYEMTAVTLATDQKEERRNNFKEYGKPVYEATRSASMRLRTAQSCMAGTGFPQMNPDARTHLYYARNGQSHGDPIVDVDKSEEQIEGRANGLFHAVHMTGNGITHASPWDNWTAYEPYYRNIFARIDAIMVDREMATWYKTPRVPQPK
jgi:hypothetical protein